ncbi:MAG: hypothetical protein RIQ93_3473 [Verrucomicrobiota bacterium]|jgi:uncharacterized membrane protein
MRTYSRFIGILLGLLVPLAIWALRYPPDGRERADWLQFMGRFHTVLVHLPVSLIALVPVLELLGLRKRWEALRHAAVFVLGLATLATIIAAIFGALLAYSGGYAGELVREHMFGGILLPVVCGVAVGLRSWMIRKSTRTAQLSYGATLLFAVVVMTWTGHQGGSLTHGDGYLTQRMPVRMKTVFGLKAPDRKASPGQPPDAFYLTHIQPIFDDHCVVCHGARKKKGGLLLETYSDLAKGGENGPVVTASNLEKSELYRRITLPGDHKEFMPSDGKKPLTKQQVLLITQWINAGASPAKTLSDLQAEGVKVAAPVLPRPPAAPDYRPFMAQITALEAKLRVRLIPVSQLATDGIILRTISEPQKVDDALLAQLAPLASLIVDAELARTKVTDKGLVTVATFTNLRRLDLAHTSVTSAGVAALVPLAKLRALNLVGTRVDDRAAPTLRRMSALQEVHAFGSKMSEEALASLQPGSQPTVEKSRPTSKTEVLPKADAKLPIAPKKAAATTTPDESATQLPQPKAP